MLKLSKYIEVNIKSLLGLEHSGNFARRSFRRWSGPRRRTAARTRWCTPGRARFGRFGDIPSRRLKTKTNQGKKVQKALHAFEIKKDNVHILSLAEFR